MNTSLEQLRRDPSVLLTLAETDRHQAVELFSRLTLPEQQALIARANDEGKKELLFMEHDSTELVQSLPVQQMHQAMEAATASESDVLLEILTPEQLVYMLDVQCWRGEHLDQEAFLAWLSRINGSPEGVAAEAIARADTDLLASGLRPLVVAQHVSRDEVQLAIDMGSAYTFVPTDIEWQDEAAEEFFAQLYSTSSVRFNDLCMRLVYDSPDQVDFNAYVTHRLRRMRAAAPDTHATSGLYTRGTTAAEPRAADTTGKSQGLAPWSGALFLEQAMARAAMSEEYTVDPLHLSRRIDELLARVTIADGRGLSAHERSATSRKSALYVSLGLEVRSQGDVASAVHLLSTVDPVELFQSGYALVGNLHAKVRKIRRLYERRGTAFTVEQEALILNAERDVPRLTRPGRSSRAVRSVAELRALQDALDAFVPG